MLCQKKTEYFQATPNSSLHYNVPRLPTAAVIIIITIAELSAAPNSFI